jgi:divalent metal cation (Fe/Co/Zn/Cd) transporter
MNDNDFKKLFTTHKADIPDDGFSERVIRRLPERRSVLPQMVMIIFIMIGLILTFAMPGFATSVIEQISSLATSISHSQVPSASSIAVYLGMLALLGTIGFSVAQVEV